VERWRRGLGWFMVEVCRLWPPGLRLLLCPWLGLARQRGWLTVLLLWLVPWST
jgi:hypothetical protein